MDEFTAVLNLQELDPRVNLAIQLGAFAGLRLGEIQGLKWGDIENGNIHVTRSYVSIDGERDRAKHGSNRTVPLPQSLQDNLDAWRKISPAPGDESFILFSFRNPLVPIDDSAICDTFKEALGKIGITHNEQRARGLVFHGLRHWYVSQLLATLPEYIVRILVGHKHARTTEGYSHIVDFEEARKAVEGIVTQERGSIEKKA